MKLVQRLIRRGKVRDQSKGVDRYFSFDYMGSSEFEFGALPRALKAMRSMAGSPAIKRIEVDDHVAWFVGREEDLGVAREFFLNQLGPVRDRHRFQENPRIARAYGVDRRWSTEPYDVTGWWALDTCEPFALFMRKSDAKVWLKHGYNEGTDEVGSG